MSYQVFALRARPQSFSEVIGQEPIVSALSHALNKNKLHHAYLLTGTRGVGKTTLARIIAKSLNCEQGVSSAPCNTCSNCTSISQGKFPDLIEIDAASKTKVEDTRALLDTVIYAPTQGKYKVYLIDEVHMLSTHSFNALLKTLEEPPEHVKFLLATTDPDKIPATILSRCLQFALKWVDSAVIANHLEKLLMGDDIKFEPEALQIIAQAAQGSVRDSLSLLEQAVALGAGEVTTEQVRIMLGRISGADILKIIQGVISKDNKDVLSHINQMAMYGVDFTQILNQLIYTLHQIAVVQQAPDLAHDLDVELHPELPELAKAINPQDLQIYYQIALLAKKDLPYSPQPKLAIEMALIRMINFVPVNNTRAGSTTQLSKSSISPEGVEKQQKHRASQLETNKVQVNTQAASVSSSSSRSSSREPLPASVSNVSSLAFTEPTAANWGIWVNNLDLTGMYLQILKNTEFVQYLDGLLELNIDPRFNALVNDKRVQEIESKLEHSFKADGKIHKIKLKINKTDKNQSAIATPANVEQADKQKKHENLVANMQDNPHVKEIIKTFNGELRLDSVELTDN